MTESVCTGMSNWEELSINCTQLNTGGRTCSSGPQFLSLVFGGHPQNGYSTSAVLPRALTLGASVLVRAGAASVLRVRRVGGVCQPRLPLPHVPVQALGQALKPVVHQVVAADGGHWVTRRSDLDAVGKRIKREDDES